ncbi:ABC transporter ATP-binding protein [Nocardioides terrisoli]|uniref:ABC transporter ATP-binding protein n=1 Tax=Nocardioides terrisoli TaxID=3388267 RepID=UPI00287B65B3|nr:ABC transporter ATP-binding protein [Nocardioides marmorisolisilvae]
MRTLVAAVQIVARSGPREFGLVLIAGAIAGTVSVPSAWLTKHLVDRLSSGSADQFEAAGLAVLAALLTMAATQVTYLSAIAGAVLEAKGKIATETSLAAATVRHLGTEFLDDAEQHDRLNLARRGAEVVPTVVPSAIVEVVSAAFALVCYGVLLWETWPLMVVAMVAVAGPTAYVQVSVNRRASGIVERNSGAHRWHEYFFGLFVTGATARDMRIHGVEGFLQHKLAEALGEAQEAEIRAVKRSTIAQLGLVTIHGLLGALGAGLVASAVSRGAVSIGDFVLFSAAVLAIETRAASLLNLHGRMSVTLRLFGHFTDFVSSSRSGVDALKYCVETPPLRGEIRFDDVWFRYSDDVEWVLRGVSLSLPVGKSVGLVGLNGEGKTTMVRLLTRLNTPNRGRILWDGVDIATFDPASYRCRVTGVLQDRPRYEMTLHDNVAMGRGHGADQRTCVERALKETSADAIARRLPQQTDTLLSTQRRGDDGTNGTTLSGGQWDRVALARAAFQTLDRPPLDLVVLDEPNAGLDPRSEAQLLGDLEHFGARATRLLISHRLAMLRTADYIAVLESGRISEFGPHDELMSAHGAYYDLFATQSAAYLSRGRHRAAD